MPPPRPPRPNITLAANSYFQAFFCFQSIGKGRWCKSALEYLGTLICVEIHVKMWTLDSVKGVRPFVGVTVATVENSPVIRLVCVVLSSVWVGRPGPRQGRRGWGGQEGACTLSTWNQAQRRVSSGRDEPAGGGLRAEVGVEVCSCALREGAQPREVPGGQRDVFGRRPVWGWARQMLCRCWADHLGKTLQAAGGAGGRPGKSRGSARALRAPRRCPEPVLLPARLPAACPRLLPSGQQARSLSKVSKFSIFIILLAALAN